MDILLEEFDPAPWTAVSPPAEESQSKQLVAINIECKYLFVDDEDRVVHEYFMPDHRDIHNLGGYVNKVVLYRDPALREHLRANGVSRPSFQTPDFPILKTRSPQLDLLLFDLVRHLRERHGLSRVSLLDHGCSVAEHYDLLDLMLDTASGGRETAGSVLSYCGLDYSPLLLAAARYLHPTAGDKHFRLVQSEGSEFTFAPGEFDLSLSVGVINHVADGMRGLEKLIRATRHAVVMAVWLTTEDKGFWVINHAGNPSYFFSMRDLARLQTLHPGGRFLVADFIPEASSSQQNSYVGVTAEQFERMGAGHLVYTSLTDLPFDYPVLEL